MSKIITKIVLFKNYIKIFFALVLITKNPIQITIAKIFNKALEFIVVKNGVKLYVGGVLPKASLSMFFETWYAKSYNPNSEYCIQEGDIVFDVGANVGVFTTYAASSARGVKVFSFEPMPKAYTSLEKNVKVNNFKDITLEQLALSGSTGAIKFYTTDVHDGCHSMYNRGEEYTEITVQAETLENYCKLKNITKIDFLKLDCEGGEYDILLNMNTNFLKNSISKISMECHDDFVPGMTHEKIKSLLEKNNFSVFVDKGFLYGKNNLLLN